MGNPSLIYTCPKCGWELWLPTGRTHLEAQNGASEHRSAAHPEPFELVLPEPWEEDYAYDYYDERGYLD